jgi:hypothetical protein
MIYKQEAYYYYKETPMNREQLLALKKETELKLAEIESKLQETETSFVDSDGDIVSIEYFGDCFKVDSHAAGVSEDNIHDLIRILTNFASIHNL